jgi:hypothetical protein
MERKSHSQPRRRLLATVGGRRLSLEDGAAQPDSLSGSTRRRMGSMNLFDLLQQSIRNEGEMEEINRLLRLSIKEGG